MYRIFGGAIAALVMSGASDGSAAEPRPARGSLSRYEEETVARVLSRHGVELDPEPEGKRIEEVAIEVLEVVEERDPLPGFLNGLHCTTRHHAVRRDVLFREGQPFERSLADETERNLRALRQQSLVLVLAIRGSAPDRVRVLVLVKDVWSLRLNTSYRITGRGLENLYVQPSEENLLGMRRSILGTFGYDPATFSVGGTFTEPRLADSRILASVSAFGIWNHETGALEGTAGAFEYGIPIYSTRQRWAWGAGATWRDAITRRFSGRSLAVFNADADRDPENACPDPARCIPIRYRSDVITGTVGVTRSFPGERVQLVQVALNADRRAFRTDDLSGFDPDAAARFVAERVPASVTRNGPMVRYQIYENRWAKLQEVETLGLQENFRLGVEAHARVYPLLRALGSTQDLVGYYGALSYTHAVRDGLLRLYGAGAVEVMPSHDGVANATVQGGMRVVTPRFGFGRLIYDATFLLRPENQLNTISSLGGDGRLRGYLSGLVLGKNMVAVNLEFRSRALQLWTFQVGGALFYDVGDAFDAVGRFRPKQGIGGGLRLGFPQLDRTVMRVDLGFPLTKGLPSASVLDGLVVTFDQAFDMPGVTSQGVIR